MDTWTREKKSVPELPTVLVVNALCTDTTFWSILLYGRICPPSELTIMLEFLPEKISPLAKMEFKERPGSLKSRRDIIETANRVTRFSRLARIVSETDSLSS